MKNLIIYFLILVGFPVFAQQTYVPDDNFEQTLIDQGYDDVLDDYVLTANISGLSALHVSNKYISDLTGIEGFTSISQLHCQYNELTSLDLSANTNLQYVYAFHNELNQINVMTCLNLQYLDVSHNFLTLINLLTNPDLTNFYCYDNLFPSLDVTHNTNLEYFECWQNSLTSIDVSNNPNLLEFFCDENQITSLDVSNNLLLERFLCTENLLTTLDVSVNSQLEIIKCYDNSIASLDFSNNALLEIVLCGQSSLTFLDMRNGNNVGISQFHSNNSPDLLCIFVDDASASFLDYWSKDPTSYFVETQAECDALHDSEIAETSFQIYPNPVHDTFTIESNKPIQNIDLFNLSGQLVKSYKPQIRYTTADLSSGVYLLKIQIENSSTSIKLVLQ